MRSKRAAIDDLRLAIACLPRGTRVAMLEGIARNDIIVGAYSSRDGICPMLAAHRAGGRTSFIAFAEAWDRFAERTLAGKGPRRASKRPRRATQRELLVLKCNLEASLLDEATAPPPLAAAIADHRALLARHDSGRARPGQSSRSGGLRPGQSSRSGRLRPGQSSPSGRLRPGDPDRSRELRRAPGWAWTRVFRRYDDYERALLDVSDSLHAPA